MKNRSLIFDADDTLWENNVFFEAAIDEFLGLVNRVVGPDHPIATDSEKVLHLLNEIELESIPRNGYGSRHFVNSLKETFGRLYHGPDAKAHLRIIDEIGDRLRNHPVHLMPGVGDLLEGLREHHRLLLLTKGEAEEQSSKVERSGLKHYFDHVEIVEEKDTAAYHRVILRHLLDPDHTFMIGNSPRSDVFPALDAGLWAVFVPHAHTWKLEHDEERLRFVREVEPHPRLLVAESLQELPVLLASVAPAPA